MTSRRKTAGSKSRTLLWKPTLGNHAGPLYRTIAAALKSDIAEGRLHAGDRLPTQRELADALGVSLGTVTRAYQEAERQGLISSRVGRGTFVSTPSTSDVLGLPDSRLIEMSVDLPVHQEDPDLALALQKIARGRGVPRLLRYHDHAGTARHRRAGAAWAERFGVEASPDDVIVCAGTQHALCVSLMAIAEPGDIILCDSLTYPGMRAICHQLRLRLEGLPMKQGALDPSAVEAACKKRRVRALYCIPSLHNPTTGRLGDRKRRALARIAEKHDFWILEDDVHRLMSHEPAPPIATRAPDRTFFIASFSKAVTGGLRVAFLVPPASHLPAVTDAVWATIWMVPTLAVEVAATWIEDGTADEVVARKRAEASRRQERCASILTSARYDSQPSGYYTWLHLPAPWTSAGFARAARKMGVAVSPSGAFLVGSSPPPPAVRVCLGAAESGDEMARGLEILAELLRTGPIPERAAIM
ncbi:MAG: PLP-dependent aminotransferase family protein [Planctomycetota bacterium]